MKRKAFTLSELVITMAVSAIILVTILASISLFTRMNALAVDGAKDAYQVMKLKDYMIKHECTDESLFSYDSETGVISYDNVEAVNVPEVEITIFEEDGFIKGSITYLDGESYRVLDFCIKEIVDE